MGNQRIVGISQVEMPSVEEERLEEERLYEDMSTTERIEKAQSTIEALKAEVSKAVVISPEEKKILVGAVALGSLIYEGGTGTGKTKTGEALAGAMHGSFSKIIGSSDLEPKDIKGARIYNPKTQEFEVVTGPIFSNVVLFDEVSRAAPKTVNALIEPMGSGEVTPEGSLVTHKLPTPHIVIATKNPNEIAQGTYEMPLAPEDRFKLGITKEQTVEEEIDVALAHNRSSLKPAQPRVNLADVANLAKSLKVVQMDDQLVRKTVEFNQLVRSDNRLDKLVKQLNGSRKNLITMEAARYVALEAKRENVTADDIKFVSKFVLPHRMHLTFEAEEEGVLAYDIVQEYSEKFWD